MGDLTGEDITITLAQAKALNYDSQTPMLIAKAKEFLANAEREPPTTFEEVLDRNKRYIENNVFASEADAAVSVALRIALMHPDSRKNGEFGAAIYRYKVDGPNTGQSEWRYTFTPITQGRIDPTEDGGIRSSWDGLEKDPLFRELLHDRTAGNNLGVRELVGELHSHPFYSGYDGSPSTALPLGKGQNQYSGADNSIYASNSTVLGVPQPYSGYLLMPNGNLRVVNGKDLNLRTPGTNGRIGSAVIGAPTPTEMLILSRPPID